MTDNLVERLRALTWWGESPPFWPEIAEAADRIEETESDIALLEVDVTYLTGLISKGIAQRERHIDRIAELEADVVELEADVAELEADVKACNRAIHAEWKNGYTLGLKDGFGHAMAATSNEQQRKEEER